MLCGKKISFVVGFSSTSTAAVLDTPVARPRGDAGGQFKSHMRGSGFSYAFR